MNSIIHHFISLILDLCHFVQYGDLPTWLYVRRGMKIGKNFCRQSDTKFDISNCFLISFGNNVTIANRCIFLAHDDVPFERTNYRKVGKIGVGDNVFIGACSTILHGVTIGDDAIIAAGSLVNRDVKKGTIVAGVPAREIGFTDEYIKKCLEEMKRNGTLDITYPPSGKISDLEKNFILKFLEKNKSCYVKEIKFSKIV